ncbi:MAG: DUF447 domain-containing protein [Planctomycetota bacterium]
MILEGVIATSNEHGAAHVSAMGPEVDPQIETLTLRPFETSSTLTNLQRHPYGVFHVTDDVEQLVAAALPVQTVPLQLKTATVVPGHVLSDCCRWYEFKVRDIDASKQRAVIQCEIVHCGHQRDFFGFNRAKHAVVEATILATRLHLLPREEVELQIKQLEPLVRKTAGPVERRAWETVVRYVATFDQPLGATA